MNEKNSFIVEKDGKKIKCDVLFTFDSEETGKHYMAYTDNTKDANGKIQVYANCYNPPQANTTYHNFPHYTILQGMAIPCTQKGISLQ